jgi:putative Holliday junction resolvase
MKYLGIDYGSKRIGLAVSNREGTIAFPRTTIPNDAQRWEALKKFLEEEHAEVIVVGDTRTLSGHENPITNDAVTFARRLETDSKLPLVWVREAGSTVAVADSSAKSHDDAAAAAFLLQRYLDMRGSAIQ